MSGMVGLIDATASPREVVTRMADALVHGGPDVQVWDEGPVALAWRGTGPPPMAVTDDVVVILLGGLEIDEQEDPVRSQPSSTDPARLLAAWRRHGIDLVQRQAGDFAAVLWDRRSSSLHLIRDRTGLIPVVYAHRGGSLAFASDIPGLLGAPWVSREVARDHLAEYLSFRAVHPPRTLLRDVHQLEAGHRLRHADGAARLVKYFTPTYAAPGTPVPREADIVPELNAAIDRAVRRRLAGGGTVGVYLSGGVGSTAVAAAARAASRSLLTFTVAFSEDQSPESPFAGRVARLLGMDHHTVTVGSRDIADQFDATVAALGHPIGNVSAVLQYVLARAARAGVERVLTGDGADQLFGGSMLEGPAAELKKVQRFHALPGPLRSLLAIGLRRSEHYSGLLVSPQQWALEEGIGGVTLFDGKQRRSLLRDGLFVRPAVRREVLAPIYGEVDSDVLNAVMHAFFRVQLGADILPRVDATAAAAGLEVGFPLLDAEVQRLAMLLPGAFKVRGLGGSLPARWLLRAILRGALPPALINRPDRHMPRPLEDWLEGPGRLFLEERFQLLRADPLGLWHHTGLEALKRALVARHPGASHRVWALFILDQWMRSVRAT